MNILRKRTLVASKDVKPVVEFKRAWKPILPKLPQISAPPVLNATPVLNVSPKCFTSKGNCYICGQCLSKDHEGVAFVSEHLQSKSNLVNRLCEVMGESYMIVVVEDDALCLKCHQILTQIDVLEKDLQNLKTFLRSQLVSKYIKEPSASIKLMEKTAASPKEKDKVKLFECGMCDLLFENLRALRKHKVKEHLTVWTCHFCDKVMDDSKVFTEHMKSHLSETQPQEEDWLQHKDIHKETETIVPEEFLSVIHSNEDLNVLDLASIEKPEGITFDGFEENQSVDLINIFNNQETSMETTNIFACAVCQEECETAEEMTKHIEEKHELKSCSLCPDVLGNKEEVDAHVWAVHNNPKENTVQDINQYTCHFCGLSLPDCKSFRLHLMECNQVTNPLICGKCGGLAESEEILAAHFEICVPKEPDDTQEVVEEAAPNDENAGEGAKETCTPSTETFPSTVAMQEHEELNPDPAEIQCPDCELRFYREKNLNQHRSEAHTEMHCRHCLKVFNNLKQLKAHETRHARQISNILQNPSDNNDIIKPPICGKCGALAESEDVLAAHLEVCDFNGKEEEAPETAGEAEPVQVEMRPTGQKKPRYLCTACGETFPSKAALSEHEESNPDHLEIQCPDCDLKFHREKYLNYHRNEAHTEMHCRHCTKVFKNLKQLKAHETRHARSFKTVFQCTTCLKVYETASGLRNHMATHTGEYTYSCEFCGKGCVTKARAIEHRASHTKEARYTCDICDKKFSVQATYWIHRKWHDNPKPYQCNTCGQYFKHSSLLSVHQRKHTGERPYVCEYCETTFPVRTSLKRHMLLHTGDYSHTCKICKTGFTAKYKLAGHMSKVHNDHTLYLEQIKRQSRNLKMAVREPQKEQTQNWVEEDQSNSGQLLTLQMSDGEFLLAENSDLSKGAETKFIVLEGDQEVQYQVQTAPEVE